MNLFIDAGNTAAKWQLCNDAGIFTSGRFDYSDTDDVIDQFVSDQVDHVWIAEVGAGSLVEKIKKNFSGQLHHVISEKQCLGVVNSYEEPEKLGVDRFLAVCEAFHLAGKRACCVIDIGTAATVDVVDECGVHQGGHIVPGLSMLRDVLQQKTNKVRFVARGTQDIALGKSTQAAVENGSWAMLLAWAGQEAERFRLCYAEAPIYVTGALAEEVVNSLSLHQLVVEQDLVINALKRVSRVSKL